MAASVSTQYWSSIPSVPLTKIWTCSRRWNFFQLLVFNPRDEYYLDHEIIIIITITAISVMPYEKLPQRCMQWRKKTTTVSKVFSMDLKSERERERESERQIQIMKQREQLREVLGCQAMETLVGQQAQLIDDRLWMAEPVKCVSHGGWLCQLTLLCCIHLQLFTIRAISYASFSCSLQMQ